MKVASLRYCLPIFVLVFSSQFLHAQKEIPDLWGMRIHDEAHVLSESTINSLESSLAHFEDSTSTQIAVLIVQSLDGEVLEDYSLRVAEHWKLGQKGKDNGALLFIAIDEHGMRIETGYGLEGPLPDARCAQIIRNVIAPNFRNGDFDAGVSEGVEAIMLSVSGEYVADDSGDAAFSGVMSWQEKALVGVFLFFILGIFTFIGLATKGRVSWFLYVFLVPFYAVFPGAIFGWNTGLVILFIYLVGYVVLKLTVFRKVNWIKSSGKGSGWSSSGGWSSGGGGWSSGGGGFSGGGGSFGGGGSSGSW